MRNRKDLLLNLISLQGNIDELEGALGKYSWDIEQPLLIINSEMMIPVLKKCIHGDLDFKTLTSWANAIECRDDLGTANQQLQEIMFELANPEINGEITKERLMEIVDSLQK